MVTRAKPVQSLRSNTCSLLARREAQRNEASVVESGGEEEQEVRDSHASALWKYRACGISSSDD